MSHLVTYKSSFWTEGKNQFMEEPSLSFQFRIFNDATNEVIREQIAPFQGKISFTALHAGYHTICVTTASMSSGFDKKGPIKLEFDISLLGKGAMEFPNKQARLTEIGQQIQKLQGKLMDLRQEQENLKVLEIEFRNLSERVNSKVVWWSLLQVILFVGTAFLQLRHLKTFFRAKKLV